MAEPPGFRAGIVTISDTRSSGERADTTTAVIRDTLEPARFTVTDAVLVPDEREAIEAALVRLCDEDGCDVVLTTGGTGLGPRDVTPEATRAVCDRDVPGFPEAVRAITGAANPKAYLSRAVAGQRARTLIVNLPGSPDGVREALEVLLPLLGHAVKVARGGGHP